jgi:molybdopterin/thiamine biosynthesis adenylyltransferase
LAGAGALGGVIATELANAGLGHLHLIDGDVVDPATFCRQVGTLQLAGLPKANAIAAELALHSPHTTVVPDPLRIGNALNPSGEHEHWSALVQDADLVIDATANPAASRYLAALAAATGTAFLHASATAGGHGGLVARIRPGRTAGCWACLAHHRADHTIPTPPSAADGLVHPARCTQPTFTGTGTDLRSVALHAARLAIATLIDGQPGAYPDFTDDVHIASLFDTDGHAMPVRWYSTGLPRHRACPLHADTSPNPSAPVGLPVTGASDTGCASSAQPVRGLRDDQRGAAAAAGHSTTAQAARREAADRTESADAAVADHNAPRTFRGRREKGAPGRRPSTSDPDPTNSTEETNRHRRVDVGARDETGTTGGDSQRRRPEHRHHTPTRQAVQQ